MYICLYGYRYVDIQILQSIYKCIGRICRTILRIHGSKPISSGGLRSTYMPCSHIHISLIYISALYVWALCISALYIYNLGLETHIEHAVCLIHDQVRDTPQVGRPAVCVCMCVWWCVCVRPCACICTHTYVYINIHICVDMYIIRTSISICMCRERGEEIYG